MPTPFDELRDELNSAEPSFKSLKKLAKAAGLGPKIKGIRSTADMLEALKPLVPPELPDASQPGSGPGGVTPDPELELGGVGDVDHDPDVPPTPEQVEKLQAQIRETLEQGKAQLAELRDQLEATKGEIEKVVADLEIRQKHAEEFDQVLEQLKTSIKEAEERLALVKAEEEADRAAFTAAKTLRKAAIKELEDRLAGLRVQEAGQADDEPEEPAAAEPQERGPAPSWVETTDYPALLVINGEWLFREIANEGQRDIATELARKQADGLPFSLVTPTAEGRAYLRPWGERPPGVGLAKKTGPAVIPAGAVQATGARPAARPGGGKPGASASRKKRPHPAGNLNVTTTKHPTYPGWQAVCPGVVDDEGELRTFYGTTPAEARMKAEAAGLELNQPGE